MFLSLFETILSIRRLSNLSREIQPQSSISEDLESPLKQSRDPNIHVTCFTITASYGHEKQRDSRVEAPSSSL
jgi:hypothetical protein